ncbi:Lipid A export ATP-binding/permease protein MsbA [Halorubrum sp. DM2]|uniref:ABC transporter ATP-binding protein n=1 Tax=Halorubrum sp. DM2 TaxID=2527867 RepID=UPI0024B791FE|nr:ABC transporter ATP-binding protein [Halorubrum sp. DM2]VTT88053.1 Lipid A export ATP-binding/permease protein MsbA [Halorubrum sp. DM2]
MNESAELGIELSIRERLAAVKRVAGFNPPLAAAIIVLSVLTAALEGVGIAFLVPIIEQVQGSGAGGVPDGGLIGSVFARVYGAVGIPLTLATAVGGVALVITVRVLLRIVVGWLEAILRTHYMRELKTQAFERAVGAQVSYFDAHGSDEVLNAIVTQSKYASRVIRDITGGFKQLLLAVTYTAIALYLAPVLTVVGVGVLGVLVFLIRTVFDSALSIGSRVADANEQLQRAIQTGTQGIRDVKLFTMTEEVFGDFQGVIDEHTRAKIKLRRNRLAFNQLYALAASLAIFALIYFAVSYASLTLSALGMYLFTMFRLAPQVSSLNKTFYKIEENLPHLVRTWRFIDTLEDYEEVDEGDESVPVPVTEFSFRDVDFRYRTRATAIGADSGQTRSDGGSSVGAHQPAPAADARSEPEPPDRGERVLDGVSFEVERGDFVAFVGPSGAGKSTIASLSARLYNPDGGAVVANGRSIDRFDLTEWRSNVAVVRQKPFIFDESLRYNVTVGNRDATEAEMERVCELASVTEFLDELPDGYDTVLGEDGVKLSGGQRQRVAIARALLKDAEILVLDEATSDLDTNLEAAVHAGIERGQDDQMLVVIAHRLSTVVDADRIHYVENGRIRESGAHGELVAGDGPYADMYERQ